jgi:putative SOS response-associated peptidase YedK
VSQPFLLREAHGHPFALAALWHSTTTADGEVVESVSILTCAPLPPVASIHDRMPLVIPREALERWLQADAEVTDLLKPKETHLVATMVSTLVNSPKNDDPRLIEPAAPTQGALF